MGLGIGTGFLANLLREVITFRLCQAVETNAGSVLCKGKLGRMVTMPQPYPKEFRDDVVHVGLNRDSMTTIGQRVTRDQLRISIAA